MSNNSVFKVYPDQPIKKTGMSVWGGSFDCPVREGFPDLSYALFSGQYTHFPQPKDPNDHIGIFDADEANLPSSSNPALITRNNHDVLAFDASSNEIAYFDGIMPQNYKGNDVLVTLDWTSETGVVGNAVWQVELAKIHVDSDDSSNSSNLDSSVYGDAVSAISSCPSTSGTLTSAEFQLSEDNLNGVMARDNYRLRVTRLANDGSDTMGGDAHLYSVQLEELF